jgi:hypothetical protein
MITAPPVMGGKISGGWVNFTLTIDPAKWVRIQLTLTLYIAAGISREEGNWAR